MNAPEPARTVIWNPDPDRDDAEGELGRCLIRGRFDSLDLLGDLLPGLGLHASTQRADGGTAEVSQVKANLSFLDPPSVLDHLLTRQDTGGERLRLVQQSAMMDPALTVEEIPSPHSSTSPAGRLAAVLDEGNTVIMNGVDRRHRTLRRLAEHVSRANCSMVNINAYVSLRPQPGFGPHWDDHEVLILQLMGSKRWSIHHPEALSPHKNTMSQYRTGEPVWKGVLTPGDFAYLPRGWGHEVVSLDELSFHLTVSIPRYLTLDLLNGAVGGRAEDALAASLVSPSRHREFRPPMNEFSTLVHGLLSERRLARSIGQYRSRVLGCQTQSARSLAMVLSGRRGLEDVWVRSPHPGGVMLAADPQGRTHLAYGQHVVEFEAAAVEALAPVVDGRARHSSALLERAGSSTSQVVHDALRAGLLEVVDDPGAWGVVVDRS